MALEIGFISLAYNAAKDLLRPLFRRLGKEDPVAVVQMRQKWKSEIEKRILESGGEEGWQSEMIVRDIRRANEYPSVDVQAKGISSWFKVGLLGTYHRGVLAGLRVVGLKFDDVDKAWRGHDGEAGEKPDLNAYMVGRIPYEQIVGIDWDGDEYYAMPHFYCRFTRRGKEPYERIVFCEKRPLDHTFYFSEIARVEDVRRMSKKRGVKLNA